MQKQWKILDKLVETSVSVRSKRPQDSIKEESEMNVHLHVFNIFEEILKQFKF